MTEREKQLENALREMVALYDDIMNSNNVGNMVFQDYARLNEAPMNARRLLES